MYSDSISKLGTQAEKLELHLEDDLVYDSIDERLVAPFDTFLGWSKPRLDEFRRGLSENRMYNRKLWVAATCHLALTFEMFDWKLRLYKPEVDIVQLAGYDLLLGGGKRKRWTCCFDLKGNITVRRSEHSQSTKMFLYMLKYFHCEIKNETKFKEITQNWIAQFN